MSLLRPGVIKQHKPNLLCSVTSSVSDCVDTHITRSVHNGKFAGILRTLFSFTSNFLPTCKLLVGGWGQRRDREMERETGRILPVQTYTMHCPAIYTDSIRRERERHRQREREREREREKKEEKKRRSRTQEYWGPYT